ncbi:hypothetical protein QBC46DRAFT_85605 [Diplogelasinospora grovesii]|uniref:Uncharacterized protein n=1 Tax=Diplogelasinospora grovesii TaxID=303347 RepID=A0AAN6MWF4_9PEZI|nr:hypothetical protein QBC46DRAFT_85605 [Diplogelasinospora grovesii]
MPFELDTGPTPLTALPLVSTLTAGQARRLLVYRDSADSGNLRLTEEVVSRRQSGASHTHQYTANFVLKRDKILPLYAIHPRGTPRHVWIIEVICEGLHPMAFSFATRQDALELQRFFTGYKVIDCFEGVDSLRPCSKSERSRFSITSMFGQLSQVGGVAEVQLWEWAEEPAQTQLPPSSTRGWRSPATSLAPSVASTAVSDSGVTTMQTDFNTGRQAMVAHLSPPPMLVLFIQEATRYTMMKADISTLATKDTRLNGCWLELCHARGLDMEIQKVSVDRRDTASLPFWNLMSLMKASSSSTAAEVLKCQSLWLKFRDPTPDPNDTPGEVEIDRFETALLQSRLRRLELIKEMKRARYNLMKYDGSRRAAAGSASSSVGARSPPVSATSTRPSGGNIRHSIQTTTSYASFPGRGSTTFYPTSQALRAQMGATHARSVSRSASVPQVNMTFPDPRLSVIPVGGGGGGGDIFTSLIELENDRAPGELPEDQQAMPELPGHGQDNLWLGNCR